MAHHLHQFGYGNLINRLNLFPQGAPPSSLLIKILKLLFEEKEAGLVSLLPLRPFTVDEASKRWKMKVREAKKILENLAKRALLVDIESQAKKYYVLPPPMAGFFEFSMMRLRHDIDQKTLSELFFHYINSENEFVKSLFLDGNTQLGRVFVNESALNDDLYVLDYERASHVIESASHIGVSICYCRHKMSHMGKACDAPMDICMTFNLVGSSLIRNGFARQVNVAECMSLLESAKKHHLVQFGDNVQKGVNFICNCCACCCEAMIVARKFGFVKPVHTTSFIPEIQIERCVGCGQCIPTCPVEALSLIEMSGRNRKRKKKIKLDEKKCLGCGVCVDVCPENALFLSSRRNKVIPPFDTAHRVVLMAIERGKLQNLIFDNQLLWSHRILAAVLGIVLKLDPIKRAMAARQLNSLFLGSIAERMNPQ